jgi:hypothetical protein
LGAPATGGGAGAPRERAERVGGRGVPPWLLAVVAALVAAAASAVVVYFATRSDDSGGTGTPQQQQTTTPTEATTTAPEPTSLEAVVPAALFQECQLQEPPAPGADENAICFPTTGSYRPAEWEVSIYPDQAAADEAYESAFAEARSKEPGLTSDQGTCPGGVGEGGWKHPGDDVESGRAFCYVDQGEAIIGWVHYKQKGSEVQPNHLDVLGIARISSSEHFDLNRWWRYWHHQIGKITA